MDPGDDAAASGEPAAAVTGGAGGELAVSVRCANGDRTRPTVSVDGVLDRHTAGVLRAALQKSLAEQPVGVIVDMSRCRVPDEASLTVFSVMGRQAAAWPGCAVVLFGATPETGRALHRMAIDRYAPLCRNQEEARWRVAQPESVRRLRETLLPVPASVPVARRITADACTRWYMPETNTDAQLVVAELVANVIRHAHTPMDLLLTAADRHLHIAVRDGSRAWPHRVAPRAGVVDGDSRTAGTGGHGLVLVESFAEVWGCAPTADGKVVWATLRCGGGPRAR